MHQSHHHAHPSRRAQSSIASGAHDGLLVLTPHLCKRTARVISTHSLVLRASGTDPQNRPSFQPSILLASSPATKAAALTPGCFALPLHAFLPCLHAPVSGSSCVHAPPHSLHTFHAPSCPRIRSPATLPANTHMLPRKETLIDASAAASSAATAASAAARTAAAVSNARPMAPSRSGWSSLRSRQLHATALSSSGIGPHPASTPAHDTPPPRDQRPCCQHPCLPAPPSQQTYRRLAPEPSASPA